jgi:hypothetical protein
MCYKLTMALALHITQLQINFCTCMLRHTSPLSFLGRGLG